MSKPAEGAKKDGHGHEHKNEHGGARPQKSSGPLPDGCHSWGCKAKAHRFNFCDEHYEHFKFGLIRKSGEPVSDYDKKYGHFVAMKAKAQKVA